MRVHKKAVDKLRKRIRELTSRRWVNDYEEWKTSLKRYVEGWVNYFKLADMGNLLKSTDEWMRRRIRMVFGRSGKDTNKMAESPETWGIQFECGNTRKFKKRLLAHCRQPNHEHRPFKRKA